ncbi:hypothetical protein ACOT81_32795 [Streptomyces sp. WI04-05B]|uniref:hypothetical protein n=1 Tax=Streptomyces TaxID=1883 RepID=UPI0029BE9D35|nr:MULTISPECIES: hypothetical protein [unclassified Streptomyces]MDX2547093.1 hypothetical protein [Streptomyces sp. WI04-05B]MDX2589782.1 hypothetical protein [Streptomyces sp. WI04-05A]MDX3753232.1 hypothetical protein [Streptomyces sp. AK08-02]
MATTDTVAAARLTGFSGDPDYFRIKEYRTFEPEAVVDVLKGRSAGVVFRGVIAPDTCAELSGRFWSSPDRERRTSVAPSYYLGTYHYHKTTRNYLDESERTAAALESVLDIPRDPLTEFYDGLAKALAPEGVTVRRAEHDGRQACRGLLRSWHGAGDYTLDPHEDTSQCAEPRQADFEIQGVLDHEVCALNICLENGDGGRLAVWNIQPDEESKRRLGLEHSGSPYPMETLDSIECQWLEINAGDVYVFNGGHIHAVEPNIGADSRRTTLAGIFGFVDRDTVALWT